MMLDVVVVGGGPTGCYAASLLARAGVAVHLFEEHPVIGEPVDCSGVIGAEAFTTLGSPSHHRIGEINTFTLVSPAQLEIRFVPGSPLAYIVDRAAFDRALAKRTAEAGAALHLGCRVVDLNPKSDCVEVFVEETVPHQASIASGERGHRKSLDGGLKLVGVDGSARPIAARKLHAKLVLLAGGPRYKLQRKLGMGEPKSFLRTAQTEVPARGMGETKVLLGSSVAPGSFAWVVPFCKTGGQFARIGVSVKKNPVAYLRSLLRRLFREGHLESAEAPIRSWVIPISPLRKTFADRVLAVGDAAGQTKPTTGGGIYYGLICAAAAAETISLALKKNDFSSETLREYERRWRKKLGREITMGAFFRHLAERLTDREIDALFRIVQSDGVLAAISHKARFDWHRDVIRFALKNPALGRIFLRGLLR